MRRNASNQLFSRKLRTNRIFLELPSLGYRKNIRDLFVKGALEGYYPVAVKVDYAFLFDVVAVEVSLVAIYLLDTRI